MLSKAKIKLINSLKLGKYRKQHNLFVAEGTTNVLDFLNSNIHADSVYATEDWITNNEKNHAGIDFTAVAEKELKKISFLSNPSPVVGVFKIPEPGVLNLDQVDDVVLMLDDIRDPGNLGTIIRTADWFGIRQIYCSEESVDVFNPKVVQASMGSLSRVEIHYENLENLLQTKPKEFYVYGAVMDGEPIQEIVKPRKSIILIGNEAHGISKNLIPFIDQKITIPGQQPTEISSPESLNASIATAIICYEFRR